MHSCRQKGDCPLLMLLHCMDKRMTVKCHFSMSRLHAVDVSAKPASRAIEALSFKDWQPKAGVKQACWPYDGFQKGCNLDG